LIDSRDKHKNHKLKIRKFIDSENDNLEDDVRAVRLWRWWEEEDEKGVMLLY